MNSNKDLNWNDLSLSDFMSFEVYRHDDIAEIIMDYCDDEDYPEFKGFPIRLLGFQCSDKFSDFEVLEKGHEYYLDLMEEVRKNNDNV